MHVNSSQSLDPLKIKRYLIVSLLFLASVFIANYTIRSGNIIYMMGFIVLPFLIMLISKPQFCFISAVVLAPANIGVYREFDAAFLLRLLVCATFLIAILVGHKMWRGETLKEKKPLLLLIFVVLVLMYVRGAGLRILGSSTWGGTVYIHVLSAIFFFFAVNGLSLKTKVIDRLVKGLIVGGILGGVFTFFGWSAQQSAGEYVAYRLMWLRPLSGSLLALSFFVRSARWKWVSNVLIIAALVAIAATGFRSLLVGVIMTLGIYLFFKSKNRILFLISSFIAGLMMWGTIVAVSPAMPNNMQRAISFVPGATVDQKTALDATHSIDWRLEIWEYALARASDYLIIGRGGTFDVMETVGQLGIADPYGTPWQAFLTHTYHSGPIEMLLDYGIPGLLAVFSLHVLIFKRLWGYSIKLAPIDTASSRYASYLCASQLWLAVSFYIAFGYMVGFANWLVQSAVVMVITENILNKQNPDQILATKANEN